MDDFAFDLDKALDELEEEEVSEERHGVCQANPTLSDQLSDWTYQTSAGPNFSNHELDRGTISMCNGSHDHGTKALEPVLSYEPPVILDLDEADFAPSSNIKAQRLHTGPIASSEIQNGSSKPVKPPGDHSISLSRDEHMFELGTGDSPAKVVSFENNHVSNTMNGAMGAKDTTDGLDAVDSQFTGTLESDSAVTLPDVINSTGPTVVDTCSSLPDQSENVNEQSVISVSVSDIHVTEPNSDSLDVVHEDISQNTLDLEGKSDSKKDSCDSYGEGLMIKDGEFSGVLPETLQQQDTASAEAYCSGQEPFDVEVSTSEGVMDQSQVHPTKCKTEAVEQNQLPSAREFSDLPSLGEADEPSQPPSKAEATACCQQPSMEESTEPSQSPSTEEAAGQSPCTEEPVASGQLHVSLPVCCGSQSDSKATESDNSEVVDVVGFCDNSQVDLDISNDEMEQYLSTIGGPSNYSEFDAKPSLADEMAIHRNPTYSEDGHGGIPGLFSKDTPHDAGLNELDTANEQLDSATDQLDSVTDQLDVPDGLEERRDSGGSVEKFLVPTVMSPGISTPIEDPGYSKVPGYMPEPNTTIVEETEEDIDMDRATPVGVDPHDKTADQVLGHECEPPDIPQPVQNIASPDMGGARPKEQVRISRPNSLLGLSTPDLPSITPPHSAGPLSSSARDSGIVEDFRSPADPDVYTATTAESSGRSMNDIINMQLAAQKHTPQMKKQMNLAIKQQILPERAVSDGCESTDTTSSTELPGGLSPPATRPNTLGSDLPQLPSPTTHVLPVGSGVTSGDDTSQTGTDSHSVEPPAGSSPRQKRPTSLGIVVPGDISEGLPSPMYDERDIDETEAAMEGVEDTGAAEATAGDIDNIAGAESPQADAEAPVEDPSIGAVGPLPSALAGDANPPSSANINLAITDLGKVPPVWVPDAEAAACMQCDARFTFTKRRHHCRACGKVFCNSCCNLRSQIQHMGNKEARVCSKCYQDLIRAQVYERMHHPGPRPNPNNPSIQRRSEGPKQVMFSDGIRPGGDLTELDGADQRMPPQRSGRRTRRMDKTDSDGAPKPRGTRESRKNVCLIPDQGLPPVLLSTGVKGDFSVEENPDPEQILPRIRSVTDAEPVVFVINKNLFVLVKIVNLDCCVNRVCWCFTTKGMCTAGQDEIVIVLECLPDEKNIPRDIFCHMNSVYEEASKGNTVSHLGHTIFAQGFLDSRDHSGFLYINATYQCLQKLILPPQPYIFGILLQKWETPWAKVFPVRLLLRLGAEYRYYPCPLISVRFRKPVFGEIGHTIMNLLADFRNYQYMLPQVPGVTVHMEDKQTTICFPRNRYNNIMKVLTNSNDHVMALGANFSLKADSHLVCLQNEEGNYQTQAINIQNKPRKITGASFVVFNGAFKQSSGLRAKSSIVEDGLMVQITAEAMAELKEALRNMQDFVIGCGSLEAPQPEEVVTVQWVEDDTYVNIGVISPVDLTPMDGVPSIRIHNSTDFVGEKHTVRWTEVFFIQTQTDGNACSEPVDLSRLAESLAQATCGALTPLLEKLHEAHLTKIALRATIDPDKVCYEVGSNGSKLPDTYMDALDTALIPVIHSAATQNQDGPVVLELLFHIIE